MEDESPELAAINELHTRFQKFAALSHEQGIQILSHLHLLQDLFMSVLTAQGIPREEIDRMIKTREELLRKHYRESAEALRQVSDALTEVDEGKPPM